MRHRIKVLVLFFLPVLLAGSLTMILPSTRALALVAIDSYADSNVNAYPSTFVSGDFPAGGSGMGQTFNSSSRFLVRTVAFLVQRQGNPTTGTYQAAIFRTTSQAFADALPSSQPIIVSATVPASDISTGTATFTFTNQPVLERGIFAIALISETPRDNNNDIAPGLDTISGTHPGRNVICSLTDCTTTAWGFNSDYDMAFDLQGEPAPDDLPVSPEVPAPVDSTGGDVGDTGFLGMLTKTVESAFNGSIPGQTSPLPVIVLIGIAAVILFRPKGKRR